MDAAELGLTLAGPEPDALAALREVSELRQREALPALAHRLSQPSGPTLRAAMVRAVGYLGGPNDGRLLARFSEDPDAVVRLETLKALARMRVVGAVPLLVRAATADPEPAVLQSARTILGTLRPEVLADHLSRMVGSAHEWVRRSAVRYAATALGAAGLPILRAALDSPDELVRAYAAQWVEQLAPTPPAVPTPQPEAAAAAAQPADTAAPAEDSPPGFRIAWDNFLGDPTASLDTKPRVHGETPEMDVPSGAMFKVPQDVRDLELALGTAPPAAPAPPAAAKPAAATVRLETSRPDAIPPAAPVQATASPSKRRVQVARPPRKCAVCGEELPAAATRCHACGELLIRPSAPAHPVAARPAAVAPMAFLHAAAALALLYFSLPLVVDQPPRGLAVVALAVVRLAAGVDLWRGKSWSLAALAALQANELRTVGVVNTPVSLLLLGLLFLPSVRGWTSR
ncbi:MAG: HEAT repeat domain-containing protein [Candidatus Wallbacteria bacterium]|nr:HEAT repeat domain-containing protein [Candidatus Wallbacteria bacterium]